MKLKRLLAVVLVGTMAASMASGAAVSAEEKQKLVIWSWGADEEKKAREDAVAIFQENHPEIEVEHSVIPTADHAWDQKAAAALAAGTGPDVMQMSPDYYGLYSDYFEDLQPYLEKEGVNADDVFTEGMLAPYYRPDGKLEGMPLLENVFVLAYNKDLFDQFGVDYPTDDWTWDDAMDACEKISALGDDIYGIYQPITFNEFFKVAAQYGGGVLNADKTEFTINSEENLKAATMMISKITDTNVQPTEAQMGGMGDWDLFESGRLGMIPTGIWAFNTFADACDFNWDICVEPGGTQKATHFFSNALVVNADSDKKEAAATWINWLASSDTSAQMRIDAGWDLPAISNEEVLSGYLKLTPPENRQAVFDSLNYLTVAPIIEDYSLMSDIITGKLSLAAGGEITVQEALDQAQEECSAQISLQ